jgi:hypothetical protein
MHEIILSSSVICRISWHVGHCDRHSLDILAVLLLVMIKAIISRDHGGPMQEA